MSCHIELNLQAPTETETMTLIWVTDPVKEPHSKVFIRLAQKPKFINSEKTMSKKVISQ